MALRPGHDQPRALHGSAAQRFGGYRARERRRRGQTD